MKVTEKQHYQITLLYGTVLFLIGFMGIIFPETLRFIANFCFIFGATSLLQGLLYLIKNRRKKDSEKEKV
ncbi:hypothetical protein LZ578_10700 [Jeotgalibaca sp. MA1X17-3]|uniref:hypothetical protein n=1 Tax=Jeotgalibaca sp. MA1X17-3 TaxID=2908211 RepID=UPI001F3FE2C7|nr:hypothetical protein [Jeotgalibaca sp. MA1X17-3]UJF15424.1 hypothetical protein LZ578_10700 [Jeotgalibaca sp. MA1X17-3]